MSQSALTVLCPSNAVPFRRGEGIVERPSFLRRHAPTLNSPGARLQPAQSIQKLGPDKSKQTVECQPGFLFNTFSFVTAFIFFFCFYYNWRLQLWCFLAFFSMRCHQDVECPTLGSFQPSEFNICLCQRENGDFSHRYFSLHWWKECLWFVGTCGIFYYNSWYNWRKRQAFRHTALVKDKLVRKNFYSLLDPHEIKCGWVRARKISEQQELLNVLQ